MSEGWSDFYLLIGSAAAALVGLLFVVTTLTTNMETSAAERGQSLYMTPVVFHLSIVLMVSALALVPALGREMFAVASAVVAVIGAIWSVRVFVGILASDATPPPHWSDRWCYGACPFAAYAGLAAACWRLLGEVSVPERLVALFTVALVLIAVRNAWDLVTWLAPRSEQKPPDGSS